MLVGEWRIHNGVSARRRRQYPAQCRRYCGADGETLQGGDAVLAETMYVL